MKKDIRYAWVSSTTFKFCFVSWVVVLLRYIFGGADFGWYVVPATSAGEFATAFVAIIGVWLGREVKEAFKPHVQ